MLFSYLKRKFFAVEERDDDATFIATDGSEAGSPRKRLRLEQPASIHEATTPKPQNTCAAGPEEEQVLLQDAEKQSEQRMGALNNKIKEVEQTSEQIKKEAEGEFVLVKELTEETMACIICKDMIHNPQLLQCGHSACYACLRSWWTQPLPENVGAEIIDTAAESDLDDETPVVNDANPVEAAPPARPRHLRRHRFWSAVKCEKFCPYCNEEVTRRPTPELRIRDVVETLKRDLSSLPPNIRARREARLRRRRDPWHGIFEPENQVVVSVEPAPAAHAPPPQHPDPILNHIAQAQFRRAEEEAVARRRRRREQAYQDGRIIGILKATLQLGREDQARPVAMPRPLRMHELVFGGGNPPLRLAGPGVGGVPNIPLLVLVPQRAIHDPPVAVNDR